MAQINKPDLYFNTKLYTGTGATASITGVGFQPDWTWIKCRNVGYNHNVYDSVRGVTKPLLTNLTNAETTETDTLISFDSDGFSVGDGGIINQSSQTYVAWNWLANGAGSANTDGSISSTVSANTTAGFSIVSYTGSGANATIGHGLGSAPKVVIVKTIDAARDWTVYHGGISGMAGGYIILNASDAFSTAFSTIWNNTNPTSSVFSVGTANTSNNLNSNYIAYCFAEKQGYSKFGSYTGNGSNDGPFIYTGFKPAFVIFKRTDGTGNWTLLDNKRIGYNGSNYWLEPNTSDAEDSESSWLDLLSNGFKFTVGGTLGNASGSSYIYMAFAENPFVTSTGVPATAR